MAGRYWKCPQCGAVLKKGLDPGLARVTGLDGAVGTATCSNCSAKVSQAQVYQGRYDVHDVHEGPSVLSGVGATLGKPIDWLSRKLGEGRQFFVEVKAELKKVSWPGKEEVRTTTIVVVATTVFFGFYLWGLDIGLSRVLSMVLK